MFMFENASRSQAGKHKQTKGSWERIMGWGVGRGGGESG